MALSWRMRARACANIALIKYWGKKTQGIQLPINPSLSFTLKHSYVDFDVTFLKGQGPCLNLTSFLYNGHPMPSFEKRIVDYLRQNLENENISVAIKSQCSFPHSAGIASSAASMAALALIVCRYKAIDREQFYQQASILARLGSGSACRSVYGGMVLWGEDPAFAGSSDQWAIPLSSDHLVVAPLFRKLRDTILLVDSSAKEISSSAGHRLMNDHPYREARVLTARNNLYKLCRELNSGDWREVANVVESEALGLHALMMTSTPSYLLLKPATLAIVDKLRHWRARESLPLFFTLDAGPNLHLIYPDVDDVVPRVKEFIKGELLVFCENQRFIDDEMSEQAPCVVLEEQIDEKECC
ncbi:MAG: diphosphomevalonate decarboxylase [Oligoflexia bacterium]|nr:diphosphomevalonate decarboxylase [Oligoflexia bacterium]